MSNFHKSLIYFLFTTIFIRYLILFIIAHIYTHELIYMYCIFVHMYIKIYFYNTLQINYCYSNHLDQLTLHLRSQYNQIVCPYVTVAKILLTRRRRRSESGSAWMVTVSWAIVAIWFVATDQHSERTYCFPLSTLVISLQWVFKN